LIEKKRHFGRRLCVKRQHSRRNSKNCAVSASIVILGRSGCTANHRQAFQPVAGRYRSNRLLWLGVDRVIAMLLADRAASSFIVVRFQLTCRDPYRVKHGMA
jgi:hypothetical protein